MFVTIHIWVQNGESRKDAMEADKKHKGEESGREAIRFVLRIPDR